MFKDVVPPEEKKHYVESLRPMRIVDVGSPKWLDMHEKVVKLSQQAILEAGDQREEEIMELFVLNDKLKVLIQEAYCILLWKTRVLPHLLDTCPSPQPSFLIYAVLFHEGAAISILDTVLYHANSCEALQDCAVDLIDYCAQGVSQLIGLVNIGFREHDMEVDVNESILSELERQKRSMIYKIGMRCISILSYLAENSSVLSASALRRLVTTHDVPWLMADVLHFAPWTRTTKKGVEKFVNERWMPLSEVHASRVVKHEVQAWFCLRQLLFNKSLMESYELNRERCNRLGACEALLHDLIMDQLPPLVELKPYLCHLKIAAPKSEKTKADLLFEEIPEIQENLIKEAEKIGGFVQVAQNQENTFLCMNKEHIIELANRLNVAYNAELLADIEDQSIDEMFAEQNAKRNKQSKGRSGEIPQEQPEAADVKKICHKCSESAVRKCSRCLKIYYCSRDCQVADWPHHKKNCEAPWDGLKENIKKEST